MLQPALRECVARAVRRYLHDLDSQMPEGVYDLVLREVETPLLREVLAWAGGNQSRPLRRSASIARPCARNLPHSASAPIEKPAFARSLARARTHRPSSNRRV
jgi:DNA-binding protein Fis